MIDSDLTDLLERAGGRTEVGPPPIDAMRAGATRRRRRRTAGVSLIGAAAVAAVIGGTALLTGPQATTGPPVATPSQKVVPEGMRLVGWGHVAIAVPKEWAQNAATCGAPQKDTVLIDHVVGFCLFPRPAGVESVQLEHRAVPSTFRVDQKFAIDGVPAERQRTTCVVHDAPQADICTGMVNVPSLGVWLRAESSTNARRAHDHDHLDGARAARRRDPHLHARPHRPRHPARVAGVDPWR
jgi:hypothetical protein